MPHHLNCGGMFNYCFITVNDYVLVYVMVTASRFGRCSVNSAVAGCGGYYVGAMGLYVSLIMCHFSLAF